MWRPDVLLGLQLNQLRNGHLLGTEESGHCGEVADGEVGVLYDNFFRKYMFFFC